MSIEGYSCRPVHFALSIVAVFLTTFYIYKSLEHSIRERLLKEIGGHSSSDSVGVIDDLSLRSEPQTGVYEIREEEKKVSAADLPSAPPLDVISSVVVGDGYDLPPPPSYETVTNGGESEGSNFFKKKRYLLLGANDLEWHRVFNAFNEKRMSMSLLWTPPPVGKRPLDKCLSKIDEFLNTESHPVSEGEFFQFLKCFGALTNLVYVEALSAASGPIIVPDTTILPTPPVYVDMMEAERRDYHREVFVKSFVLLIKEYAPKTMITDRVVPFGYDWFIFSGRMTYAIVNAHVTLCSVDRTLPACPYYSEEKHIGTRQVVGVLKNICKNFTESLGYERHGSNRVYIGVAFLYASLLDKACTHLTAVEIDAKATDERSLLPDYKETLDEILTDPANRYDLFKNLIDEIGKIEISTTVTTPAKGPVTYDGVYEDRTFFAHRRLRMYAYVRAYCEQLPSVQLLVREKQLDDGKLSVLLRAVEPMSDAGSLFYFNLHSRAGGFKYRNGSALFAAFGLSEFATPAVSSSQYGRVYVADRARILFVQSRAFTFHSIGQLSDLAFGEVEKSNRDLMPAWLMAQRPLFHSEKNKLVDVPCGSHLEPCVVDTGKSEGLEFDPIGRRNTTDYTPTEASSAVVAFEEDGIGAVFTSVGEKNMDVRYSRCTVATPYYTFTTYFRITRFNDNDDKEQKPVRLSCYTGCSESPDNTDPDGRVEIDGRFEFKHCSLQLFVQTADGRSYDGRSVTVEKQTGVDKRNKSKCKYNKEDLHNVSLSLKPFGRQPPSTMTADTASSVTILYRPKSCKQCPIPKIYDNRKISPVVVTTASDAGFVHRLRIDARYVLYCDTARKSILLLDVFEKRACLAPILSRLQDDPFGSDTIDSLLEKASAVMKKDSLGTLVFDTSYNNRIYAYFQDDH